MRARGKGCDLRRDYMQGKAIRWRTGYFKIHPRMRERDQVGAMTRELTWVRLLKKEIRIEQPMALLMLKLCILNLRIWNSARMRLRFRLKGSEKQTLQSLMPRVTCNLLRNFPVLIFVRRDINVQCFTSSKRLAIYK